MFAISRGVLRYCERLATPTRRLPRGRYSLARRFITAWRTDRSRPPVRLNSGELVARVGADVDALADVLVRVDGWGTDLAAAVGNWRTAGDPR